MYVYSLFACLNGTLFLITLWCSNVSIIIGLSNKSEIYLRNNFWCNNTNSTILYETEHKFQWYNHFTCYTLEGIKTIKKKWKNAIALSAFIHSSTPPLLLSYFGFSFHSYIQRTSWPIVCRWNVGKLTTQWFNEVLFWFGIHAACTDSNVSNMNSSLIAQYLDSTNVYELQTNKNCTRKKLFGLMPTTFTTNTKSAFFFLFSLDFFLLGTE